MSILKNKQREIKPYEFGQLVPHKNEFVDGSVGDFKLKSLDDAAFSKNNITPQIIRQERENEARTSFQINPLIRESRGLNAQEKDDYEKRVSEEVTRRLEQLSKQAYEDGYNAGLEAGQTKAYDESIIVFEERINGFEAMLHEVNSQRVEVLQTSQDDAYKLIKNLTKWIVLKEIDDKDYVVRLLEKLILEMNTKSNLLIRVDHNSFKEMPEVLEKIQSKIGQLTNVRVEIAEELYDKGIVLESENGIIEGSLEAQFKSIDKLFEAVGV